MGRRHNRRDHYASLVFYLMNPILFPPDATAEDFSTHGLGNISDAASCIVKEQLNGEYTATMTLPADSIRYGDLRGNCLVLIKPNPTRRPQPFRVIKFSRPLRGMVKVYMQHWSYDLSGYPVAPFSASTAVDAVVALARNQMHKPCPFSFAVDLAASGRTMTVSAPTSTRQVMGDQNNQILRTFGGEWSFDRQSVQLTARRGADRGFSVRYGKNLVDLKQEEMCAEIYSAVIPFWVDTNGVLVQGTTINSPGTPPITRILPLDMSDWFRDPPTVSELDQAAQRWVELSNPWVPKVNIDAKLAVISAGMEPDRPASLDKLELGDTVRVSYERLGVETTARVIETNYDALAERFESVVIGTPVNSAADSVVDAKQEARAAADEARAARNAASAAGTSAEAAGASASAAGASAEDARIAAAAAYSAAALAQGTADQAQGTANQANSRINNLLDNLSSGTVAANYFVTNMLELKGNGAAIVFGYNNYRPKTVQLLDAEGQIYTLTCLAI